MHFPKPQQRYISDIFLIDNCKICEVRLLYIISCSETCFEIGGKHKFWAIDFIFVLIHLLFLLGIYSFQNCFIWALVSYICFLIPTNQGIKMEKKSRQGFNLTICCLGLQQSVTRIKSHGMVVRFGIEDNFFKPSWICWRLWVENYSSKIFGGTSTFNSIFIFIFLI